MPPATPILRLLCLFTVLLTPAAAAAQTTYSVSSEAELRAALGAALAGDAILFQNNITLTADLPSVSTSLTINGGGFTLSGAGQYRGFLIAAFEDGSDSPSPITVALQNLTIANTLAAGGAGGAGENGGGGGGGLGGAIFIGAFASVTLSNVSLLDSTAQGGTGGAATGGTGSGGGGGMGGDGGQGGGDGGGGGGGAGTGASGGSGSGGAPGIMTGAAAAGGSGLVSGGNEGGGGGSSTDGGAGGGVAGQPALNLDGGAGGFGGGGGGSAANEVAGPGGFGGGGGGGNSGFGGYGGGGGGHADNGLVFGGIGGGDGGELNGGGGGGAGFGGALFIAPNGSLTVIGSFSVNGNQVRAGLGASGGTDGAAAGAGLFLGGFGMLVFDPAAGMTQTITDTIADEYGALGQDADLGQWTLYKTGEGTLVLSGANLYAGGTIINQGVLSVAAAANLGLGYVAIQNSATLALTGSSVFNQELYLSDTPSVSVAPGVSATWAGLIHDEDDLGRLGVTGGGTLTLTQTANTYSGGTLVTGNSTLRISADGALGDPSGLLTLGGAATGGTLAVASGNSFITSRLAALDGAGGTFQLEGDAAVTWLGQISGAGSLMKSGTGTLTLGAVNTYTGATDLQGGLLRTAVTGALSQGALSVASGAALDLAGTTQTVGALSGAGVVALGPGLLTVGGNNTSTLFSGNITGAGGQLVKVGAGALALTGFNDYSGGTLVSNGALIGHTFSLQGSIVNNALVVFDQAFDGTFGGVMSGSGTLFKFGTGTVSLFGANSYGGGTLVSGNGGLAIGADAALGTGFVALGDAATSGALRFFEGSTFTSGRDFLLGAGGALFDTIGDASIRFTGLLAGAGGLTKSGSGTLTLAGSSNYTGATNVLDGTLRAAAPGAFGSSGQMLVAGAGTLDLDGFDLTLGTLAGNGRILLGPARLTVGDGGNSLFAGSISGSGSLVKSGAGTLVLVGANDYTGGTLVENGTLAGNTTSLQGDLENNAVVVFDQNFDGTYTGSMTGTGLLAKTGSGTLTLLGSQAHTGGTLVAGGALQAGYATLGGTIVNDSAFTFVGDDDGTFGGLLAGGGSYFKTGAGTMTMTGAHGMSGTFNIANGTLVFDGALGGNMTVAPGATLRASGFLLGSLSVDGALSAGLNGTPSFDQAASTPGLFAATTSLDEPLPPVLTIGGNFLAAPGSTISMPLSTTLAPSILVGGSAALHGTHLDFAAEDIGGQRTASFLALTALNGLSVNDATASTRDPLLVPFLRRTQNSLIVTLLNMGVPLAGVVTNPNAISVGGAVDVLKEGATGDRFDVVRELTALDDDGLNDALKDIAGEIYSSGVQLAVLDSETFTDMLRDQLADRTRESSGLRGWGGQTVRWWAQLSGQRATFSGNETVNGGFANMGGGAGGFDWRLSERFLVGGGGGYGAGNMGLRQMAASTDYRAPRVFGYGGFKHGRFGLRGGGSAARSRATTDRRVAFAAFLPDELGGDLLTGGIDRLAESSETSLVSDEWSEYNDNFEYKTYTIDTLFGIRRAQFSRQGLVEQGLGALALRVPDQTIAFKQLDLRFHVFRREGDYRPFFQSTYRRELTDGQIRTYAHFSEVPGADFEVAGIPIPENLFAGRAGMTLLTILGEMTFQYQFRIAPGQRQHSGDFRLRW